MFYKELIKVLFMDQVDKQAAIQMEKRVNMIIMSINDQIDEIEIRQVREESKGGQPQLEIQKRAAGRSNSSDVRVMQQPQRV